MCTWTNVAKDARTHSVRKATVYRQVAAVLLSRQSLLLSGGGSGGGGGSVSGMCASSKLENIQIRMISVKYGIMAVGISR